MMNSFDESLASAQRHYDRELPHDNEIVEEEECSYKKKERLRTRRFRMAMSKLACRNRNARNSLTNSEVEMATVIQEQDKQEMKDAYDLMLQDFRKNCLTMTVDEMEESILQLAKTNLRHGLLD